MDLKEKYKGFILLIEYPGCNRKKGEFEPFTSGKFLNYPEIWKPVFTTKYERELNLNKIGI
jgi:hypothetical protein